MRTQSAGFGKGPIRTTHKASCHSAPPRRPHRGPIGCSSRVLANTFFAIWKGPPETVAASCPETKGASRARSTRASRFCAREAQSANFASSWSWGGRRFVWTHRANWPHPTLNNPHARWSRPPGRRLFYPPGFARSLLFRRRRATPTVFVTEKCQSSRASCE